MEAEALAVLSIPRLKFLSCLFILDYLIDPAPESLHNLKIDGFEFGTLLIGCRDRLSIDAHRCGPAITNLVNLFGVAGNHFCEVAHALLLPTWRQRTEPFGVNRHLSAYPYCRWSALEDVDLFSGAGQLRDYLHGSCARTDNSNNLVTKVIHGFGRATAGVVVVPSRCVKSLTLEELDPLDAGQLRFMHEAAGRYKELCSYLIAALGYKVPTLGIVVPLKGLNLGLEQRMLV